MDKLFGLFNKSWWLEILAASPSRGYYFGPFRSESEAVQEQLRHVRDIEGSGSEVLLVSVVRRQAPTTRMVEYSNV